MFAQSTGDKESKEKKSTEAQFPYWTWTPVNWQLKCTNVVKIGVCVVYQENTAVCFASGIQLFYNVCSSLSSLYEYRCKKT